MMFLKPLLDTISKAVNEKDHTVSVMEIAYGGTVIMAWLWLSHGVYKGHGFTDGWNYAFITLAGLVCLNKANKDWANRGDPQLRPPQGDSDAPKDEGGVR
jgi:hypothetical protein